MAISLYVLATITVTTIVVIVAAACLGVTLATVNSTIASVGEAWATGISRSAVASIATHINDIQSKLVSASILAQAQDLTTPVNDAVYRGINWTDTWVPYMFRYCTSSNEKYPLIALVFLDFCWMYNSQSGLPNMTAEVRTVEWVENLQNITLPTPTNLTVGGFNYDSQKMFQVPYPPDTPGGHDIFTSGQSLVNPVPGYLVTFLQSSYAKNPSLHSACFSVTRNTYIVKQNIYWQVYFLCSVVARSGDFLGYATTGIDLEADLTAWLTQSKHSPHSEVFVVEQRVGIALVMGTTRPDKFYTGYLQNRSLPARCFSTEILRLANLPQPWIACPFDVHTYPYSPLNAISTEFATTATFAFDFFVEGGSTSAIASERLPTSIVSLVWNVITVLPEEDLFLATIRSSIATSVGLAVLVAGIGVIFSLVALHFLIKRLQTIQEKMIVLAKLEVLDKNDELGEETTDADESGKNDENQLESSSIIKVHDFTSDEKAGDDQPEEQEREESWISEIANLETAYAATVKSMTNFTRYVSRAVLKELILQRKKADSQRDREMILSPHTPIAPASAIEPSSGVPGVDDPKAASEFEVTVLIADIEGFSSQIWATSPENHDGVLYILHVYFKRMCRLIMGHGGVVDKFMGDSIMSYWGAPVRTEHHALLATLAALALLRESKRDPLKKIFNEKLRQDVQLRCGLSTGNAIVGTFGNAESVNYSVVGNPVTQARRLQDFNRYWGSKILMDANCMRKVDETIVHRLICQALFDPEGRPVHVYEVMGLNVESPLVCHKVTADARTIAFTDVLSLPTINSANEGVSELLKHSAPDTETSLDALLIWHAKGRSSLPASYLTFAEQFSEAARCVVDMKFAEAIDLFNRLLQSASSSSCDEKQVPPSATAEAASLASKNANNSNSSSSSPSSGKSSAIFVLDVATDRATQSLIAIANIYQNRAVLAHSIDRSTNTFFVRAFKLDMTASDATRATKNETVSKSSRKSSSAATKKKKDKSSRSRSHSSSTDDSSARK